MGVSGNEIAPLRAVARSGLMVMALLLAMASPAYAGASEFGDCVLRKLADLLDYAIIATIIAIIVKAGIRGLVAFFAEEAGERALVKIAKALGKRLVPFLGALIIILTLTELLHDCLPLLFE